MYCALMSGQPTEWPSARAVCLLRLKTTHKDKINEDVGYPPYFEAARLTPAVNPVVIGLQ